MISFQLMLPMMIHYFSDVNIGCAYVKNIGNKLNIDIVCKCLSHIHFPHEYPKKSMNLYYIKECDFFKHVVVISVE